MYQALDTTPENVRRSLIAEGMMFCLIGDEDFATEIRINRSAEGHVILAFRTQGEQVAVMTKLAGAKPRIRLTAPGAHVDLMFFCEGLKKIYKEFPELLGMVSKDWPKKTSELFRGLEADYHEPDRIILACIFQLESVLSNMKN